MLDVDLPFSRAEYSDRIFRARQAMSDKGIELMVVTDPSNMAWLTGFSSWTILLALLCPEYWPATEIPVGSLV